jgi:glyoxylase-like metal-dependent hydrolase (beta-lactamase superfamily II)
MSDGDTELSDGDLIIRTVVVGALATNAYVLFDRLTRRAIVVDTGDEPDRMLDAASDLDVVGVVLTHAHWDHALGVAAVADGTGAPVLAHPDDAPVWSHERRRHRMSPAEWWGSRDAILGGRQSPGSSSAVTTSAVSRV